MRDRVVVVTLVIGVLGAAASGLVAWRIHGPYGEINSSVWRSADPVTGHTVIAFNARGYGRPNIWCFLDGTRLVRMEFDESGDGIIDRWEHYGPDETLERAYQLDASGKRDIVASAPALDKTP